MLPNEVYFDVFLCCKRIELAKGVSLAARGFNALAEIKMFEMGEHEVANLSIKKTKAKAALTVHTGEWKTVEDEENPVKLLPIPTVPAPKNIISFPALNLLNVHMWTKEDCAQAIAFINQFKEKMHNGGKYLLEIHEQFWTAGEGHLRKTVKKRKKHAANMGALLLAIGPAHFGSMSGYRCDLDEYKDGCLERCFTDPKRMQFCVKLCNRFDYFIYAESVLDDCWADIAFWLRLPPVEGEKCRQMRLNYFAFEEDELAATRQGLESIGNRILDKFHQEFNGASSQWAIVVRVDTNTFVELQPFHLVNEKTGECLALVKNEELEDTIDGHQQMKKINNNNGKYDKKNVPKMRIYYTLIRGPLGEFEQFSRIEMPILKKVIRIDNNL